MTQISVFLIAIATFQRCLLNGVAVASLNTVPNPDISADVFDYNVNFRQNMCSYQESYDNEEVELRDALKGAKVNIALGYDLDFINVDENGNLNSADPGLVVEILDEVAFRGGFAWRDSFTFEGNPYSAQGKTWTDLLLWSIETYDVSARWWLHIPDRIAKGVSFPRGWYNSDVIIIARKDEDTFFEHSVFHPFSWSRPFTAGVWLSLLGTLIVTGVLFGYIENKKLLRGTSFRTLNQRKYANATLSYIHEAFIVFTGHLDLSPRTNSGRIVSFSLSLFAMLIVLTYGANLASFLVIQRAAFLTKVDTVNQIVNMRKSMCVYKDTATHEVIRNVYSNALFVEKESEKDTLLGLRTGDCNYAIVGQSAWDSYERMEEVNEGCVLAQVGRVFKRYDSGFALRTDAGNKCTSIIRNVFNLHLQEMWDDGTIEEAWEEHLRAKQDMIDDSCLSVGSVSDGSMDGTETLDLINLSGIFIFHFVFLLVAFLFSASGLRLEASTQVPCPNVIDSSQSDDSSCKSGSNERIENEICTPTSSSESQRINEIARTVDEHSLMLKEHSKMLHEITSMLRGLHNKVDSQSSYSKKTDEESNTVHQLVNKPSEDY